MQALVDGPASGVGRKVMSFKQLHLTKFVVKIAHSARSGTVRKAWEKAEVDKKWQESTWAKKIASKLRVS
jgi:large subunit ribosomal protein L14e